MGKIEIHFVCVKEGLLQIVLSFGFHFEIIIFILILSFLHQYFGSQVFQKLICLTQKFVNLIVLGLLEKSEILLHILLFQSLQPSNRLSFLKIIFRFLFRFVCNLRLVYHFLSIFLFLSMILKELLLMQSQVLHKFFVLYFLSSLVITFYLILQFLHSVPATFLVSL